MAADQFSYPGKFLEGSAGLKKYGRRILNQTGFDCVHICQFRDQRWTRSTAGLKFPRTSLENIIYRSVVQEGHFVEFNDLLNHPSYKFIVLRSGLPLVRYMGAVPILSACKIVTGAITLMDRRRNMLPPDHIELLEHFVSKIRAEEKSLSSIP